MKLASIARALTISAVVAYGGSQKCMAQNGEANRRSARPGAGRTSKLPTVTPEKAKKLLDSDDGYIYVDVRTPEEFAAGRPKGAINIPLMLTDPETEKKAMNADFLKVVEAHIPKDAKLILGCRSGNRSGMAQRLLRRAGYSDTSNMLGGFSGQKDPAGTVLHEGWSELGYPSQKGDAGASGYDELKKKAKP